MINPGVLYQNQNGMYSLQAGLNMLKYNVYLGGYFKTSNVNVSSSSLMLIAGYRYIMNDGINLKFMYSYDIPLSQSLSGTGGAHEISLVLEFKGLRIKSPNRFSTCSADNGPDSKKTYLECSPF
jgi:hypothetical protein